jgi:diguanylate cyclase (GGDEF)-like protein
MWHNGDEDSAFRQMVLAELDLRNEQRDPQQDPDGGPTGLNAASNNLGVAYMIMRAYELGLPHLRRAVADSTAHYSGPMRIQHLVDHVNLAESCVRWALHLESVGRTEESKRAAIEARSTASDLSELAQAYDRPEAAAVASGLLIAAKSLIEPERVDRSDALALEQACRGELFGEEETEPILLTLLVRIRRLIGDTEGCRAAAQTARTLLRDTDHELVGVAAREFALLNGTDSPAWHYAQTVTVQAESVRQRSVSAFRTRLELFGLEQRFEEVSAQRIDLLHKLEQAAHTEAELLHAATHDPLTGLPNRTLFRQRMDSVLLGVREAEADLAVAFVDLDDLKEINDRNGHAAGDRVLQSVAQVLVDSAHPHDTVARLSGDEFVILTTHQDATSVQVWAERLVHQVRASENDHQVSVSVGVCLAPAGCGSSAEAILAAADEQMYNAKRLGKSRAAVTILGYPTS